MLYRVGEPADRRPARVCENPRNLGTLWTEHQHGVGGNLPGKLWDGDHRSSRKNGNEATKHSKRFPIYLLMERMINIKKHLPATAFRLIEQHIPGVSLSQLGQVIRERELAGTLHAALADPLHPLALQPPRKKRRAN